MTSVAISPNNKTAASGDLSGEVRIWDIGSGCCLKVIQAVGVQDHDGYEDVYSISQLAFNLDGSALAQASGQVLINEWPIPCVDDDPAPSSTYRQKREQDDCEDDVSKLLFYTQTQQLISAGANGVFQVWNRGSESNCTFIVPELSLGKVDEYGDGDEEMWGVSKGLGLVFSVTQRFESMNPCHMSMYGSDGREWSKADTVQLQESIGSLGPVAASPMGEEAVICSESMDGGTELSVWDLVRKKGSCKARTLFNPTGVYRRQIGRRTSRAEGAPVGHCIAYIDRATIIAGVERDLQIWELYH